ncbi:MAG TPA: hypothetical protein PKJ64_02180 [bacterium]|nr:hypothetical protein [bacterium]HMW36772.1 hypothetical protein [bacterium]HMY36093.1 hypothetical protein [bacterium]HMZ05316.1 hypothetical protein [bacterium]HNB08340.1 hypothetical protein [bacterium]
MFRTQGQYYWTDALYLARSKDQLRPVWREEKNTLYQCVHCAAFVRFTEEQTGQWVRLKPYEQFQRRKEFLSFAPDAKQMKLIRQETRDRALFRCPVCASHWWLEGDEWTHADDAIVEWAENSEFSKGTT